MTADTGKTKKCWLWSCPTMVQPHFTCCYQHNRLLQRGRIDECPGCGRGKERRYPTCLACRNTGPEKEPQETAPPGGEQLALQPQPRRTERRPRREHSPRWGAGDAQANEFYVYILKLDDGGLYAGQTRELRERLMEHRDGTTRSTAGRNPRLVWFSTVATREEATETELELKQICDRNPREIRRRIVRFRELVGELDFS